MIYHFSIIFKTDNNVCGTLRADVVFVVDSSGSIRDNQIEGEPDNYQTMIDFMDSIVDDFTIGPDDVQVGLVLFSNNAENTFFLNSFTTKAEVRDAIQNLRYIGGTTNTAEALQKMDLEQFVTLRGDRNDAQNIAIVLTDGVATDSAASVQAASDARDNGVTIYAIGVSSGVDEQELSLISSPPQQRDVNYFVAANFATLQRIENDLLTAACETDPGNVCKHTIT